MPPILEVDNLYKTYGHGDIFRDVSFSLHAGESIGLFGMSGSGKSTLGRCILGLEKLSSGNVYFEGTDIFSLPKNGRSEKLVKMQMIFQHPEISFDPRKRLFYSVTEPLVYHEKKESEEVFALLEPLINAVGLHRELFEKYPCQLSGGELQRVMMVRIFSLTPRLIIADEPTSMLDMSTQAQILHLIKDLKVKNNTTCIFISHDPEVLLAMCDKIGIISEGRFTLMNSVEFKEMIKTLLIRKDYENA